MFAKIKQKLKQAWEWTKKTAKRFKKWIIALIIGIAIAAPLMTPAPDPPPPDTATSTNIIIYFE